MIYRDHRFHYRPTSSGSVLGNITLGFYIPPPHKYTHAHLISSKRGKPAKMFFIRWPPSIVPFLENTPNSFWRNSNEFHSGLRSHGTVYCGGEKTQIDQHWFSILCWWKSKANYYSLLAGGWVGPKSPNNLETWVKMTGSSCWPNCFVCLLCTLWRLCCLLCISQNLNTNTICWIQDSHKTRILIRFVI